MFTGTGAMGGYIHDNFSHLIKSPRRVSTSKSLPAYLKMIAATGTIAPAPKILTFFLKVVFVI